MKIGKLRDQVEIQTYTAGASDGLGGRAEGSYAVSATVWANITPIEGSRLLVLGEVTDQQPYDVTIRGDATVSRRDRLNIVGDDQLLTIHNVKKSRTGDMLMITAFAVND